MISDVTQWQVGEAKITALIEQNLNDINGLIQGATAEELAIIASTSTGNLNFQILD